MCDDLFWVLIIRGAEFLEELHHYSILMQDKRKLLEKNTVAYLNVDIALAGT